MTKTFKFRGQQCKVLKSSYENGRPAILVVDAETDESVLVASSNLPDEDCGPNQAFIKDYSENAGIFAVLKTAGVVKDTDVRVLCGFCAFPLVDVLW